LEWYTVRKEEHAPAAVVADTGSVIYGQGVQASSYSGVSVRISNDSRAFLAGAKLQGAVHVVNRSSADLENAVVDRGVPRELLEDASRLHEGGNRAGARAMILKWATNNLRPTELHAVLQIVSGLQVIA
jgi:hypothetical protein